MLNGEKDLGLDAAADCMWFRLDPDSDAAADRMWFRLDNSDCYLWMTMSCFKGGEENIKIDLLSGICYFGTLND